MEQESAVPLKHWGFERWPFCGSATNQFYPTAASSEALSRIDYLVETSRRLGVLLGGAGIGKSLVLHNAKRKFSRQRRAAALVDSGGPTTREFLWNIAAGLGAAPAADCDNARLWRLISDRISENRMQQIHTVLLVDDAGQAGPDVINQIGRLLRIDPSPAAYWTIVLAAEPAQTAFWSPAMRELVDLRIDLRAWEPEDTVGYVQTALVDAGRIEPLFEDAALARLHELAAGVPRRIVNLADNALVVGANAGVDHIDVALVEAVDEELGWPVEAGVASF
jgi:general secretion pathway protein A